MLADMQVLVTGGAGFIGAHTVRALLDAGHAVTVLDDLSTGVADQVPEGVRLVRGDVRDQLTVWRSLEGADAVVHLAARSSVPDSFRDPLGVESVNDLGSGTVLDCAWRRGLRRVVLASSASVYGQGEVRHEEQPMAPRSPYAASKVAMEALGRVYRERGCQVATLRYFNVYGPGQGEGVVPAFFGDLLAGRELTLHGTGEQSRDFVHVSDVARANVMALDWNQEVNVGRGESTTVLGLARTMAGLLRVPFRTTTAPARELDPRCCSADPGRARALGWSPRIGLETGLRGMLLARAHRMDRDLAGGLP
jgi:UDP-glucose 4-epimerase